MVLRRVVARAVRESGWPCAQAPDATHPRTRPLPGPAPRSTSGARLGSAESSTCASEPQRLARRMWPAAEPGRGSQRVPRRACSSPSGRVAAQRQMARSPRDSPCAPIGITAGNPDRSMRFWTHGRSDPGSAAHPPGATSTTTIAMSSRGSSPPVTLCSRNSARRGPSSPRPRASSAARNTLPTGNLYSRGLPGV